MSNCLFNCLYCEAFVANSSFAVAEDGPRLSVAAEQLTVASRRGGNATLPCRIQMDQSLTPSRKMRIKWTKMTSDYLKEVTASFICWFL